MLAWNIYRPTVLYTDNELNCAIIGYYTVFQSNQHAKVVQSILILKLHREGGGEGGREGGRWGAMKAINSQLPG